MAKYSYEFKRMVVQEYLDGEGGYESLKKKHGIPSDKRVREWVSNYRRFGEAGLMRSRQQHVYSFEFKLHVVELYLTSELTYQEVALREGLTNPSLIVRWVKEYKTAGPEALRPKKKGRKRTMDKERVIREIEENGTEEEKKLLRQLQEENLRLRIENAFLKEARRLRLEEEARLNEQRGSSTVSEENSN